jgi:hypothetical protein
MTVTRGTSNSAARGSSYARAARRRYLVETYRADVDVCVNHHVSTAVHVGCSETEPACRCYRCGDLLTVDTVSVDRIIPGCQGGTYRRNNIRPACLRCNSETGGATRSKK